MSVRAIDPAELKRRLDAREPPVVLDVRERDELAICALAGALHIPMGDVPRRVGELDPEREIVCVCHHGVRSANVAAWLANAGFERVANLSGGIDRWARDVEPTMPRY